MGPHLITDSRIQFEGCAQLEPERRRPLRIGWQGVRVLADDRKLGHPNDHIAAPPTHGERRLDPLTTHLMSARGYSVASSS
jgi:hypothetical protein